LCVVVWACSYEVGILLAFMFSFAVGSPDRKVFWCISMYVHGIVIGSMRSIAYELHQISMCDGAMVYLNLCVCVCVRTRFLACLLSGSLAWRLMCTFGILLLACGMRLNSFPRLVNALDAKVLTH